MKKFIEALKVFLILEFFIVAFTQSLVVGTFISIFMTFGICVYTFALDETIEQIRK